MIRKAGVNLYRYNVTGPARQGVCQQAPARANLYDEVIT